MPTDNDDIEQGESEGDTEERELFEPAPIPAPVPVITPEPMPEPEPAPAQGSRWDWVGSPSRPEAQETEDGISDLFEVPGDLTDTQDLISVDIEKDILDAGPEGDLSDLVEVSEEDILGDEETGQIPLDYKPDLPKRSTVRRLPRRSTRNYPLDTSMGGFRS